MHLQPLDGGGIAAPRDAGMLSSHWGFWRVRPDRSAGPTDRQTRVASPCVRNRRHTARRGHAARWKLVILPDCRAQVLRLGIYKRERCRW
jgi:hypothetical protein